MSNPVKITVFTPLYNKASTVKRTFDSLLEQTVKDFEWLIINDGSSDDSSQVINSFQTNLFPIRIYERENKGLNRTYNEGVNLAKGDYLFRLDPDDFLVSNAIELISKYIDIYQSDHSIGGVAFLTKNTDDIIIGWHPFASIARSNFLDYRVIYKGKGDRFEVVKTWILKKYPQLEVDGEKFCRESYYQYQIALEYDLIYIPQPLLVREYNSNSISSNSVKIYSKNPIGMMVSNAKTIEIMLLPKYKNKYYRTVLTSGVNYFRFGLYSDYSLFKVLKGLPLMITLFCFIPGLICHVLDTISPTFLNGVLKWMRSKHINI